MSGDELIVLLASLVLGVGGWMLWLFQIGSVEGLRPTRSPVAVSVASLAGLTLLIFGVLRLLAADDVRNAPQYLLMYCALGLAWLRMAAWLFPFAGLHPRDDVIERRNRAALPAWIGAMAGVALCYSGANIGNGPGWWVVVFSAGLATAALGGAWFALGVWAGLTDAVVIERDTAAGIRLGGALAAFGLLFGAAVAGDWVSAGATIADFAGVAWPALPLLVVALPIERALRPRPEQPRVPIAAGGVLPAIGYLGAAAAAAWLGRVPW